MHSVLILYKQPTCHIKCAKKVDGNSDWNQNLKNNCLEKAGAECLVQIKMCL